MASNEQSWNRVTEPFSSTGRQHELRTMKPSKANCEALGQALLARNKRLAERAKAPALDVCVVEDIARDSRMVIAAGIPQPCLLRFAVPNAVIYLAAKRRWPELLDESQLHYSRSGRHLIGTGSNFHGGPPRLVTSALVHSIPNWREHDLLETFTILREPTFFSSDFTPLCGRGYLQDIFERALPDAPTLDFSPIPILPTKTRELDESVLFIMQPWKPVAMDRFTYSGPRASAITSVYQTFTEGCELLRSQGHLVALGVTYQRPFIDIMRALEAFSGLPCFVTISRRSATNDEGELHKVIVFTGNISFAATRLSTVVMKQWCERKSS